MKWNDDPAIKHKHVNKRNFRCDYWIQRSQFHMDFCFITSTKNVHLQQPIYLSNSKKNRWNFWWKFPANTHLMAWDKSTHISVTKIKVYTPIKISTYSACFVFLALYCNVVFLICSIPLAHFSFRHISHLKCFACYLA